jgi:glucose/arabinose dehydrogenase
MFSYVPLPHDDQRVSVISRRQFSLGLAFTLSACGGSDTTNTPAPTPVVTPPRAIASVQANTIATFVSPWSIAFLPDTRLLLTTRNSASYNSGQMLLVASDGSSPLPISALPTNGGVLDVILHPNYGRNRTIYFTYVEQADPNAPRIGRNAADTTVAPYGLAVATGDLFEDGSGNAQLLNVKTIWRQTKIVSNPGSGEFGGRLTVSPDKHYLFIAAGDRQECTPVQDLSNSLGKIIRLYIDGTIPSDNPFVTTAGALPEIWTLGHRNPYGLAFDSAGQLWDNENGPLRGDELNLLKPGLNYGWPKVSYGNNYDGGFITKPAPGDGFEPAAVWWTPAIAPSGLIFYKGTLFGDWKGDAIISGLAGMCLVRVRFTGSTAAEVQRIPMGARIRAVEEAADGTVWVLEDGVKARLLQLLPVFA